MSKKYFYSFHTQKQAKEIYRRLAKELHPDIEGGSQEDFKELSRQYQQFLKIKDINSFEELINSFEEEYPEEVNLFNSIIGFIKKHK